MKRTKQTGIVAACNQFVRTKPTSRRRNITYVCVSPDKQIGPFPLSPSPNSIHHRSPSPPIYPKGQKNQPNKQTHIHRPHLDVTQTNPSLPPFPVPLSPPAHRTNSKRNNPRARKNRQVPPLNRRRSRSRFRGSSSRPIARREPLQRCLLLLWRRHRCRPIRLVRNKHARVHLPAACGGDWGAGW